MDLTVEIDVAMLMDDAVYMEQVSSKLNHIANGSYCRMDRTSKMDHTAKWIIL